MYKWRALACPASMKIKNWKRIPLVVRPWKPSNTLVYHRPSCKPYRRPWPVIQSQWKQYCLKLIVWICSFPRLDEWHGIYSYPAAIFPEQKTTDRVLLFPVAFNRRITPSLPQIVKRYFVPNGSGFRFFCENDIVVRLCTYSITGFWPHRVSAKENLVKNKNHGCSDLKRFRHRHCSKNYRPYFCRQEFLSKVEFRPRCSDSTRKTQIYFL